MNNSTRNFAKPEVNNDWNIVHFHNVEEEMRRENGRYAHDAETKKNLSNDWPAEPRRIDEMEKQLSVPALACELVPEKLRAFAVDISERTQMPLELVMAPTITAFSCVVGNKIAIQPKKHDDWSIIPKLWGGLVAPSGFLKTAAISEAFAPLKRLNAETNVDRHKVDKLFARTRKSTLTKIIKTATKRGNVVTIDQLKNQIEELVRDADRNAPNTRPYDTTNGKHKNITKLINESPNGLLIIKGHLDNWLRRLSKPKHEGEREFILRASDACALAAARYRHGFVAPLYAFGEFTSGRLQKYLKWVRQNGHNASMLQRFHLLIYHDANRNMPTIDRRPNYIARENVYEVFKLINDIPHTPSDSIPAVRFSDEAQETFDQWAYELKIRVKNAENNDAIFSEHIAKYYFLMPSLALLFSLWERPENIHGWNSVSSSATDLAVRWCSFLEDHARKAYSMERSVKTTTVNKIAKYIEGGSFRDGSTLKSVFRRHETWQTTPKLVRQAIDSLEESGWLKMFDSGGEKRISLHPKFHTNTLGLSKLYKVNETKATH